MNHKLEIYIELYKRGEYAHIPIGKFPNGELFYPTKKQIQAFELLNNHNGVTSVGYGGAARCHHADTNVLTYNGYKKIQNIEKGDYVLSINEKTGKKEYKPVLKTFCYNVAEPPKMIIFANGLTSTYDHEYLFRGKWTKAFELRERALEDSRRQLLHIKQREVSNLESQRIREIEVDETSCIHRVYENDDSCKWEVEKHSSTPIGCSSIYSKSRKQATSKSHRFQQDKQLCRKFGVGNTLRKRSTFCKSWSIHHFQKRRATTSELFEKRVASRNINSYGTRCNRDKAKIQAKKIHSTNVSRRIWSQSHHYKRYSSSKKLEAREITLDEFIGSEIKEVDTLIYDLHVKDNHNYTVTKDNIIVHNSGKTILEVTDCIFLCLAYPKITTAICRKELVNLKRTVLKTFKKQLDFYGLEADVDWKQKTQENKIIFANGSEVDLIDSKRDPQDETFTKFGGYEPARVYIDESNESPLEFIDKMIERSGWCPVGVKENIPRKVFECFNPDKNHVNTRYWRPFRDNKETDDTKFIRALPSDNPHPAVQVWINDLLAKGNTVQIERQINGNFDYDDDPTKLCEYDAIEDLFTNDHVPKGNSYISADLAMKGRDLFVAGAWSGLICNVAIELDYNDGREIELKLKELKIHSHTPNSRIVADSDGIGNYLEGYIKNIKTFHGGASAKNKKLYGNIKDECGFMLARLINARKIKINCSPKAQELIKQELSICLKQDNINLDKKRLIKKDKMKELLGRSPDYLDMLLMRMYFEIKTVRKMKLIND